MVLLDICNLTKNFGGIKALSNVSLHVDKGEILGLIGPNGAGKTTFFNVVTGVYHRDSGKILFNGKDISGLKPHVIARQGVVRSFQHMLLFKNLSVMTNMLIALHMKSGVNFFESVFNTASYRQKVKKVNEEAMKILEFVGMGHLYEQEARTLSHGYQRTLSLAIALATKPALLLLDEPVAALNPERTAQITALIRRVREEGTTLLIIEHNMKAIFDVCDRVVVLNAGRKIAEGTPQEIKVNKEVIAAYLGGGRTDA